MTLGCPNKITNKRERVQTCDINTKNTHKGDARNGTHVLLVVDGDSGFPLAECIAWLETPNAVETKSLHTLRPGVTIELLVYDGFITGAYASTKVLRAYVSSIQVRQRLVLHAG